MSDFKSAVFHLSIALNLLDRKCFNEPGVDSCFAKLALIHAMHSGYNSLERGLRKVRKNYQTSDDILKFRYVTRVSYDDFIPEEFEASVKAANHLSKHLMENWTTET